MGLERPVCELEPRPIPAARSGKQRVLSECTPNHGFLGAWRLGPGCPLPRAGALLSALRVVQEWPVRASLSGLPKGSLSARGRPDGSRYSSAMLYAASATCRAVRAGGPRSVVTVRAKRSVPGAGVVLWIVCVSQYTDFP